MNTLKTTASKQRFDSRWIPEPYSGCWLWTAGFNSRGYSCFFMGQPILGHRASWLLYRGIISDGLQVLHRCDTPACVNPDHLFLGTAKDNVDDMERKGRSVHVYGGRNGHAKLADATVRSIKQRLAERKTSQSELAREFGCTRQTIYKIKKGIKWSKVI